MCAKMTLEDVKQLVEETAQESKRLYREARRLGMSDKDIQEKAPLVYKEGERNKKEERKKERIGHVVGLSLCAIIAIFSVRSCDGDRTGNIVHPQPIHRFREHK
jgi:hypothetical protein